VPASDRIDAVVAVRDGAPYLAAAIESALGQTRPPDRVIVVDDGSGDESATIAECFGAPVTVLRRPALGAPTALNAALAESDAALVAFLDADDLWLPGKLALQADLLARRPDVEVVFGHVVEFADGDSEGLEIRTDPAPGMVKSAVMARRSTLDRIGHFDTSYAVVDFPEWRARCQAAGVVEHMLETVVTRRRVHGANVTLRRRDTTHAEYLRMARAAVTRRRATARSR
jgi:glycosyltransferase involved in cell wall biosynthesis